mmetsp:Transcript_3276/g.8129  ORF Transcript_3276/g.8129 Transcript_3276/m.8129 type:complete len:83 (+) Transcript_3276:278-526(+)
MELKDFRDEILLHFGSSPPLSVFFRGSPDTLSSAAAAAAAGAGLVIRVAGPDTDAVYALLREALRPLAAELGAAPFAERGMS